MLSLIHAFKSLRSSRVYTVINLIGLTLGIACTLVLLKYIRYELMTDHFHPHLDRIYLATVQQGPMSELEPLNAAMFFDLNYLDYPEVEHATETHFFSDTPLTLGQNDFPANILTADSSFFNVFHFPLSTGPNQEILKNPSTILLKPDLAQQMFGDQDPIGQTVSFDGIDFKVAGIFAPIPGNSTLRFDAIASHYAARFWSRPNTDYLRLKPNMDLDRFNDKVKDAGHVHNQFKESIFRIVPFQNVYFNRPFPKEEREKVMASGNMNRVRVVGLIAFLDSPYQPI